MKRGLPNWAIALIVLLPLSICGGGLCTIVMVGMDVVEEQLAAQLSVHPTVVEHVGEVKRFELSLSRSADHPDQDLFFYEIEGTRGRGVIAVKSESVSAEEERITFAELKLESGEVIRLVGGETGDAEDSW